MRRRPKLIPPKLVLPGLRLALAAVLLAAAAGPIYPAPAAGATAERTVTERFVPAATPAVVPAEAYAMPFTGPDGAETSLAAFRGKLVILNFWATWCIPCVAEMPALDRFQAKHGGKDLAVVALSSDRGGAAKVEPFYRERGIAALPIYLDPTNRVARAFKLRGLPTTILIDAEGRELGRMEGAADWDKPDAVELTARFRPKPGG